MHSNPTTKKPTNLEMAQAYARVGWAVFPTQPNNKTPLAAAAPHGYKDATTDPQILAAWWGQWPDANIGIACGASGLYVIDVDHANGNKIGRDTWAALEARYGRTPTYTVQTPTGGLHLYYQASGAGAGLGNTAGTHGIGTDVDTRGVGGYVIAGGSTTPNGTYHVLDLREVAPLPEWVPQWIAGAPQRRKTANPTPELPTGDNHARAEGWAEELANTPPGERNSELNRIAYMVGQYVGNGEVASDRARELLTAAVQGWSEPDKTQRTLERALNDGIANTTGPTLAFTQKAGAEITSNTFESDVAKKVHQLKVTEAAARIIAAENYQAREWVNLLEDPEDLWLIDQVIGAETLNFLTAKPNTGKTFAYIDMMCHGAVGAAWMGQATTKFKTLVYISEGSGTFGRRVRAWAAAHEYNYENLLASIKVATGANLASDAFLDVLKQDVEAHQPGLVIFDTFNGTSGVTDENDAAQIGNMLGRLRGAVAGCAILFVHHPKKEAEESSSPTLRGSGALFGAADTVITMHKSRKGNSEGITLSTDNKHGGKSRDGSPLTIAGLYLDPCDRSAVLRRDIEKTLTKAEKTVREHLIDGMSAKEFAEAAGLDLRTAQRYVRDWAQMITLQAGPKPATWSYDPSLPPAGAENTQEVGE